MNRKADYRYADRGDRVNDRRDKLARRPSDDFENTASEMVSLQLLEDIRTLIEKTRLEAAAIVNAGLTMLYWEIGTRIRKEILQEKRAEYSKQIVHALSGQLKNEYGKGFSRTNIFNMIRLAEVFPDREIVRALSGQLSWTHFRQIIYQNDPLKRDFYAEICRIERWSTPRYRKGSTACSMSGLLFPGNPKRP